MRSERGGRAAAGFAGGRIVSLRLAGALTAGGLLAGCVGAPGKDGDGECAGNVVASVRKIATVVRVEWTTDTDVDGFVTFSEPGGAERRSAVSSGTQHAVTLSGLHALTDVSYRIGTEEDDACGGSGTITTGALPAGVPAFTFDADAPELAEGGYTVVPVLGTGGSFVVVLDATAQPVWALEAPSSLVLGARLSLDGTAVLFNENATATDTPGTLYATSLDAEERQVYPIDGAHTDFIERAPGEYATLGWDIREVDGRKLLGDTIIEMGAEEDPRVVWDAWDWITPDLSKSYPQGWYVPDPYVEDWTHVNGISYDADTDAYLVSIGNLDAVARVDRVSGAMTWLLSDTAGDFTTADPDPMLSRPHSVQPLGDSLLVFNRGEPEHPDTCSEAVELTLDLETHTAERSWSYGSERCLLVTFLGNAERLAGGNTVVDFTTSGQIDEVTADGTLAWRVNMDIGSGFGFADRTPTF
jgi:hypothetical protein